MMTVYGMNFSGNCYKVKLLLEQLQQPHQWVEMDVRAGVTREADFLRKNPNGRVPTLEYEPGQYLSESNAILVYLSENSRYWPASRLKRAQALQWMFFEQYSHEPYIAVARFICTLLPADHERRRELPSLLQRGYQALDVMQQHLQEHAFFVDDTYSVADIALYAYTHVASDGGFELQRYPAIGKWIARIERQDRYIPLVSAQ